MFTISVGKELNVKIKSKEQKHFALREMEVHVFGEVLGAIIEDKIYDKISAIDEIQERAKSVANLLPFMRCAIGKFYLLINDGKRIKIITSPSSTGFFYLEEDGTLIISEDEKEIYRHSSLNKLNDFEVLNMVISHGAIKSPFRTLFDNVRRTVGGHVFSIDGALRIKTENYLMENPDFSSLKSVHLNYEEGYKRFIFLLESCAQIIDKSTADNGKIVMLSGGVDSSSLLKAFLKTCADTSAVTWDKGSKMAILATKEICKLCGARHKIFTNHDFPPESDESLEAVIHFYENNLARSPIALALPLSKYLREKGLEDVQLIHGQNMDSGYVIDGFRPGFGATGMIYHWGILKTIPKRLWFTSAVMKRIAEGRGYFFKVPVFEKTKQFEFNPYDYLLSMVAPAYEHVVPFSNEAFLPSYLEPLAGDYFKYKEETVLHPFIGTRHQFEKNISNGLSLEYFNHLVRVLKYIRFIQGAIRVKTQEYRTAGCNIHLPASEGPVLRFFLRYQLTLLDALFPKRMLYRYFREEYGKSHFHLINDLNDPLSQRLVRKIERTFRPSGEGQPKPKNTSLLLTCFREHTDPKVSILVNQVKNDLIRQHLINIHKCICSGVFPSNGISFVEAERFFCMEIYLRSVFETRKHF
ncbi:MAG: hypothetical protein ACFFCW_03195 [Candidatus Hodarchaeota archaeon]